MNETVADVAVRRAAGIVAIVGTFLASALHLAFGLHAGALWRDEVNSLGIATMATVSEMWSNLAFDSFPALFFLLLRVFAGVPSDASDTEMRTLGVVIGLLIIAAFWLNARWLRLGFPLLSLALIGFNPMVIRYGDSIRAYGLGLLLIVLCVGTIWRLLEDCTFARAASAFASAMLSVQCLYYNSVLLFAICMGASAVCFRRRAYKRLLMILAIGGVAALSLLIYMPTIRQVGSTNFFWKVPFSTALLWETLSETLDCPLPGGKWFWIALFAFAVVAATWILFRRAPPGESVRGTDRLLFGLVTLLVGSAAYVGFLFYLSYIPRPWYYIAFIAFAALCLEIIVGSLPWRQWTLRTAFAVLFIGMSAPSAWTALQSRQTNIDLLAAYLESTATQEDLILISPFNYGISFRRYYQGSATCATVPPISDLRSHRMDLLHQQMMSPAPMAPVLQKMEETLRAGHTVWVVGDLHFVEPGRVPVKEPFYQAWSEQTAFLVQNHAETLAPIPMTLLHPVIKYEDLPLCAIRGWHERGKLSVR